MSEYRISKGYIPNLRGESDEPVTGWLRISPDVSGKPPIQFPPFLPITYDGQYLDVDVEVDFSEVDTTDANFARLSFGGGEHPLSFRGLIVAGGIGLIATGLHYQSGFYAGNVQILSEVGLPEQEALAQVR